MAGHWWLAIALMWAGLAAYSHIDRGKELIQDNWFILQTKVLIPFTTQLDSKINFGQRSIQLMALAIVSSFMSLPMAYEAWRTLGGYLNLGQFSIAVAIIEYTPIIVLCGATMSYSVYAAEVGVFATPDTTANLLWVSAMASLSLIVVGMGISALQFWGSSFASHSILAILLPIPSIVMFSTGLWVLARAREVSSFVEGNWENIRLYVPPPYSGLASSVYAEASSTPMFQTSTLAIFLSVLILFTALDHFWAAIIIQSVGGELREVRTTYERQKASLYSEARGAVIEGAVVGSKSTPLPRLGATGGSTLSFKTYGTASSPPPSAAYQALVGQDEEGEEGGGRDSLARTYQSKPQLPGTTAIFDVDLSSPLISNKLASSTSGTAVIEDRIAAVRRLKSLPGAYNAALQGYSGMIAFPSSPRIFFGLLRHDLMQLWGGHQGCLMITLTIAGCFLAAVIGSLAKVTTDGACSALVSSKGGAALFNITAVAPLWWGDVPISEAIPTRRNYSTVTIIHNFPLGSVEVINSEGPGVISDPANRFMTVEAIYFGLSAGDLPGESLGLNSSIFTLGEYRGLDPIICDSCPGYTGITITLNPPPKAASKCLGVRLRVRLSLWYVQVNITAASAAVRVTGNLESLASFIPSFSALNIVTNSAPVTLTNVFADYRQYYSPYHHPLVNLAFPPSIFISSSAGAVVLNGVFSAGVQAYGGGGVRFINTVSLCVSLNETTVAPINPPICGEIYGSAGGRSVLGVSNLLAARQVSFFTDAGPMVLVNAAALVGGDVMISSATGPVYLTNFLQGAGNQTLVSTRGKVSSSATFVNRLLVTTQGGGSVSLTEVFAGINSSTPLNFDLGGALLSLSVSELFTPNPGYYSLPLVSVSTDFGDVSVLGIGGNPQSPLFADYLSLDFRSVDGSIKMEINGGGVNANYSVSSGAASALVEIDGNSRALTGRIGNAGSGLNYISLRSERDIVQLSRELPLLFLACNGGLPIGPALSAAAPSPHISLTHTLFAQFFLLRYKRKPTLYFFSLQQQQNDTTNNCLNWILFCLLGSFHHSVRAVAKDPTFPF